jgi:hypothetical protein
MFEPREFDVEYSDVKKDRFISRVTPVCVEVWK